MRSNTSMSWMGLAEIWVPYLLEQLDAESDGSGRQGHTFRMYLTYSIPRAVRFTKLVDVVSRWSHLPFFFCFFAALEVSRSSR
jgi:hypothetical protein